MKNELEDLLRNSLGDYRREPPGDPWDKISGRLTWRNIWLRFSGLFLAVTGTAVIVVVVVYFWPGNPLPGLVPQQSATITPRAESNILPKSSTLQTSGLVATPVITDRRGQPAEKQLSEPDADPEENIPVPDKDLRSLPDPGKGSEPDVRRDHIPSRTTEVTSTEKTEPEEFPAITGPFRQKRFFLTPRLLSVVLTTTVKNSPLFIPAVRSKFAGNPLQGNDYVATGSFSAGVSFSGFLTDYRVSSNGFKKSAGVEFALSRDFRSWGISAFPGLSVNTDNGDFRFRYEQIDSIGYYYEVSSFEIDPVTGKPVFHTVAAGLYDSVAYNKTVLTGNRYYYLNLPVLFSLKAWEHRRLSLSLVAGPQVSVMVGEKVKDATFLNDRALWILPENRTPGRIRSHLLINLGGDLRFRPAGRWMFTLMPVYQYYMISPYEKSFTRGKTPWSFGLRAGLMYRFK